MKIQELLLNEKIIKILTPLKEVEESRKIEKLYFKLLNNWYNLESNFIKFFFIDWCTHKETMIMVSINNKSNYYRKYKYIKEILEFIK